ncbi:NFX1-type zinc finger-containing protein 1 [Diaphorina citri]|uniref:NFX1-type zinc finger-containing protein 1 n=1 Tax=Diaphorina citri TaxID=121845 RepID=A0A1S3DJM9_DIACI|nr:NFX1-type zinc finger-containing protein 1 [Diaphorina citri]
MSDLSSAVFAALEDLQVNSSASSSSVKRENQNPSYSKSDNSNVSGPKGYSNDSKANRRSSNDHIPRSRTPNCKSNVPKHKSNNRNDAPRSHSTYRNDSQKSQFNNQYDDRQNGPPRSRTNNQYQNHRNDAPKSRTTYNQQYDNNNHHRNNQARSQSGCETSRPQSNFPNDSSKPRQSFNSNRDNADQLLVNQLHARNKNDRKDIPNKKHRNDGNETNRQQFNNGPFNEIQGSRPKYEAKSRLGFKKLEDIATEDPHKITVELANTYNGFQYLLEQEGFLKERPDWIILITKLLAKVCICEFRENKNKVLTWVSESNFIDLILEYLLSVSSDTKAHQKRIKTINTFLQDVMLLIETLVNLFQNLAKERFHDPVRKIFGYISSIEAFTDIKVDDKFKSDLTALAHRLKSMGSIADSMNVKKDSHLDEGQPPEDFRTIDLYPAPEEVLQDLNVFLRRSIVDGGYENVEHYLDVQFRLLRQDLIAPLRTGFKELVASLTVGDKTRKRINNLRLFKKCSFENIETKYDKVSYIVCFDVDKRINVNWEYNRWFMFGSLVFFSFDNFSTFFMGTVFEKNNKIIAKDRTISVELIGDIELNVEDFRREVMMAESTIFFQPYYHVMKALKQFEERNFPMMRYIVEVNPVINPPAYLRNNSLMQIGNFPEIDIMDECSWPSPDQLGLDNFQFDAYKGALTREFVIMQGPPGTGKTYLGLKIIETLLENDNVMDHLGAPILLVCYTNHALDQFLEGILKFNKSIVRIGSQTKSELIKPFELKERRKHHIFDRNLNSAYKAMRDEMEEKLTCIKTWEKGLALTDEVGIIQRDFLVPYMSPGHQNQLNSSNDLVQWLLVRNYVDTSDNIVVNEQADDDMEDDSAETKNKNSNNDAKNEDEDDDDDDEDEERDQLRNDESLIADLTIDETSLTLHILTTNSLEKQLRKLENTCQVLENQRNLHSVGVYAKMRNDLESKWKQLNEAIYILDSQFKRLHRSFKVQDCTKLNSNVTKMNMNERWNMYWNWLTGFKAEMITTIKDNEAGYRVLSEQFSEAKQLQDMQVLLNHKILGTTTTSAAKYHLMLAALKPKIVVVEEAAEVLEAHIVTALTNHCEHLILIGDHQQLRPNPTVYELAKRYNLEISLFERMIKNKLTFSTLGVQHRMRPEICDLITPVIYPNLQNHISVYEYEQVKGITKNLFFVAHEVPEESDEMGQSYKNPHEGDFVLRLARYLLFQGYSPDQVTILTTYSGQMVYLKMQKKKMPEIGQVRISTVDNYQGEECQIILLSLVRSNMEHKIGFLATPNRVCVALSRAKQGFYLIGNMTGLEKSSQIWPEIRKQLEMHQAIGSKLELQCQVHNNITYVCKKSDFLSVTEGGCSKMCDEPLDCGHMCKSLCHPNDREHKIYKCPEKCTKNCPSGHPCTNLCYEECNLCHVLVTRHFQCGHTKALHCYIDASFYPCKVKVEVKIELCGHIAQVACHIARSNETIQCTKPCETRLGCGHACTKYCHVDEDPDHMEYQCMKPCERKNTNCSGEHMCKKHCYEKCSMCNERVPKVLPCGHEQVVLCHLEAEYVECDRPCTNVLDCNHKCRKRCKDMCGDCNEIVKKQIPDCGHVVNLKCKIHPERKHCKIPCERLLSCGHTCAKKCCDECNSSDCEVLVDCPHVESLCGHPTKVPCKDRHAVASDLRKKALESCPEPCGEILLCEHACQGSCSGCKQGRLHEMCKQKCGRVKICGHSCTVDCSALCPPCKLPCMTRCQHSKCNNPCGERCPPCQERCTWHCQHKQCRRKCSDMCGRSRCYKDCKKKLQCGHDCIGFCGEPCPPKCRICHEEEVTDIFFGTEDEEGAKFVVLQDCGHFFESSGIETYVGINAESTDDPKDKEIVMLTCPRCKTPIVNTQRFMNQTRKIMKDIAEIKKKQNGMKRTIVQMKMDVICRLKQLELYRPDQEEKRKFLNSSKYYSSIIRQIRSQVEDFYTEDKQGKKIKRKNFVSEMQLQLFIFMVECVETIRRRVMELGILSGLNSCTLLAQMDEILLYMRQIPNVKISEQQKYDLYCEMDRLFALANLLEMKSHDNIRNAIVTNLDELNRDFERIMNEIICLNPFNKERSEAVNELLKQVEVKLKDTIDLKKMIKLAMSTTEGTNQQGHWFKCRNGHYYFIGNCGRAVATGRCPDCKEIVGGIGYRLTQGNTAAPEMG